MSKLSILGDDGTKCTDLSGLHSPTQNHIQYQPCFINEGS